MTQPLENLLPNHYSGQNLAPIRPILALKEPNGDKSEYSRHYLADAIKEKYASKVKENESSWKEMISVGQLIGLFIEGKQILDWNPYTQAYTPRKLKRTDPNKIKAVNFMQVYCTMWQDKWGSSNPDIVVSALSNRDQDIAKARKANAVVNHLERKMYDAWFNYHEGLLAQVFGWYGRRVRPCNKNGASFLRPIIEDRDIQIGQGFGKCHDCGYAGSKVNSLQVSQDTMPVCPQCGSTAMFHEPAVNQMMPQIVGQQPYKIPDIIAEQLPFPACRWDIRFRAEDSSWFIFEQDASKNAIKQIIGNIRLPDGESGNKVGLDAMDTLAKTGSPLAGRSDVETAKGDRGTTVTEFYLSAEDLYDIILKGDEKTVDGGTLPIGRRASEVWPNGACFIGVNGMALLVGIFSERHSDSLSSGVYHMKPLSGTGRGVADATEMQKRFNRFDSQAVSFMAHRATPATLHLAGAISPSDRRLLGQPDVDIPVNIQNFPEVKSIRDLIAPLQGESVPGDMLQYTYEHLSNFMQLAYHTTSIGGVNPAGIKQDTATYAEIADQNANSLFTPSLNIKADVCLDTARKAFDLWCKLNPIPRFIPFPKTTRGSSRGMEIAGEDVKGEYEWSVAPGSYLPKNKLSQRKDKAAFFGMFGGIGQYFEAKQMMPQEVAEIERDFDMDFATQDYDEVGETCRTRFEFAKGLLEQAMQLREQAQMQYGVVAPPPDMLQILSQVQPTMLPTESHLTEKALWFSNLLDTNEGQEMDAQTRELASAFSIGFGMLAKGQAIVVGQAQAEVQVAANAPVEQANMEREALNAQSEAERSAVESAEKDKQSAAQSEQSHRQNLEASQLAHEQAMEQEGIKAAVEVARAGSQTGKKP